MANADDGFAGRLRDMSAVEYHRLARQNSVDSADDLPTIATQLRELNMRMLNLEAMTEEIRESLQELVEENREQRIIIEGTPMSPPPESDNPYDIPFDIPFAAGSHAAPRPPEPPEPSAPVRRIQPRREGET